MNPTTLSTNNFEASRTSWFSKDNVLQSLLQFSLIAWLAQQKFIVRMAQWCSEMFGINVAPRQAVAVIHTEFALLVALFSPELPTFYHLLFGIWISYAAYPLLSLSKQLMRD